MRNRGVRIVCYGFFAVLFIFCSGAHAEEQYQTVVGSQYYRDDGDRNTRTIEYGLQGRLYFQPVNMDGHPYAEASFLERIGSIRAFLQKEERISGSWKGNGPRFTIEANLAQPGTSLAADLTYTRTELDYNSAASTAKSTGNSGSLDLGNYFTDTWLAGITYLYSTWDSENPGFAPMLTRHQEYGLFTKYDFELSGNRMVKIQASLTNHETDTYNGVGLKNTAENVQLDYYFTRGLSAGLRFENMSGTDQANEGRVYAANFQYYFTYQYSIAGTYSRFLDANAGYEDHKSYSLSVAARF